MSIQKSDIANAVAEATDNTQQGSAVAGLAVDPMARGSLFVEGEPVMIRTVVFTVTGRVERVSCLGGTYFVHLSDAAWIGDLGRFKDCVNEGKYEQCDPVTTGARVAINAIVDIYPWNHPLPTPQNVRK